MNELRKEQLEPAEMNGPNQEPLDPEEKNGPNQEPLDPEEKNGPNQEPLDPEEKNGPNQEPLETEKMNGPNQVPLDHDKNNKPGQEPLGQDKSSDQLGSFIWGRPEIEPENNADANTVTGQHAIDGANAATDEMDVLTTIRITQKQIDKRLQCTVCLDDYELNEEAIKLTCSHIFHERCITHWIIMHGTCPVCRRYFCPGELHLPQEEVGLFRSIVRGVCRTLCSPLVYFFPSLAYTLAMTDRRRLTPMYRLIRAERVTSPPEPAAQSSSIEMGDDYIFCHVMFVLKNANNEPRPDDSPNAMAANMRRRFSRMHREGNVDPAAAAEDPPHEHQEFHFPPDVISAEYLGHY